MTDVHVPGRALSSNRFASTRFASTDAVQVRCRAVVRLVGVQARLPVAELAASSRRSAAVALARQTAMYLARVVHGMSFRDIARGFGRDPRTVVLACRRIEERRDDPRFDAFLARLELASAAPDGRRAGGEA